MNPRLSNETDGLIRSWMRHDAGMLRDYLVSSVEDPRINAQSILTRHTLVRALFPGRFEALMEAEIEFSAAINALSGGMTANADDIALLRAGLERGADEMDGVLIPKHLRMLFARLPACPDGISIPNYILLFLDECASTRSAAGEGARDVFMSVWRQALASAEGAPLSVIEPACGSANDYRAIHACGLGRFIHYTGFDLCEKNICNAQTLFPGVCFETGNVFEISHPDRSFDLLFAHDLFEHLSPEGIEISVREVCRVARQRICVHFFNMNEETEHRIQPLGAYHWNTLAMPRMRDLFAQYGFEGRVLHIGTYVQHLTGGAAVHNLSAYTFLLEAR